MPAHYDAAAMEARVDELKDEVTRRLAKSGQLDKMRAMYVDCALQLMAEEEGASGVPPSEDALLFGRSHALTAELGRDYAGRGGRHAALRVVAEYLRAHGLMHTLNVLCLETGLDEATLESGLDRLRTAVGAPAVAELPDPKAANSILQALILGATAPTSSSAPAATSQTAVHATAKPVPTVAASDSDAATSEPDVEAEEDTHSEGAASVPAPSAVKIYNSPLGPAPAFVSKGSESLYELEKCEGGEYIRFGQIAGQPFNGWRLKNCRILILDAVDSVTMDECEDCELVVAAAQNSVFIRDCKRMTMTIACKQLRTRDCSDCVTYLFAGTDPVVESSHHMDFYPYNLASPNLPAQFAAAHLDANCNRFVHMYDFTADDTTLPQPHFTVHWPIADPSDPMSRVVEYGAEFVARPENQGKGWQISTPAGVRGLLEGTVAPGSSSEKGTNKSYDIKSGASVWQQQQAAAAAASAAAAEPVAVPRPATAPVMPSASAVGSMVRKAHATSSDDDDSVGAGAGAMRRDTDDEKYDSFESDSDHQGGTEDSDDEF